MRAIRVKRGGQSQGGQEKTLGMRDNSNDKHIQQTLRLDTHTHTNTQFLILLLVLECDIRNEKI